MEPYTNNRNGAERGGTRHHHGGHTPRPHPHGRPSLAPHPFRWRLSFALLFICNQLCCSISPSRLAPFPRASLLLGFPFVITSIPALRCYKVPTSAALALTRANGSKADSRKHRAHRCSQCCGGLVSSRDGRRTRRLTLRGCVLPAPGALPTQLTSCCLDLTCTSNHSGSLWCKSNGCFLSMYIELQSS